MDDQRLGLVFRRIRRRRRLTQAQLGARVGVSQAWVSTIERGHLEGVTLGTLRALARELEIRLEVLARWRGGDLERMLNARHSQLHDLVARHLRDLPDWTFAPEVSFAIWGERGIVDILAWHPKRRILLLIELKTEIVDANELVGTFDRKLRLAIEIAGRHGMAVPDDAVVAGWVVVADSRTNRRRVQAHAVMLRAAYPADGRSIQGWLRRPRRSFRCLSFWNVPARMN